MVKRPDERKPERASSPSIRWRSEASAERLECVETRRHEPHEDRRRGHHQREQPHPGVEPPETGGGRALPKGARRARGTVTASEMRPLFSRSRAKVSGDVRLKPNAFSIPKARRIAKGSPTSVPTSPVTTKKATPAPDRGGHHAGEPRVDEINAAESPPEREHGLDDRLDPRQPLPRDCVVRRLAMLLGRDGCGEIGRHGLAVAAGRNCSGGATGRGTDRPRRGSRPT